MFDILHRVGMKASSDTVYQALATPAGVAGWWTVDSTGDSKAGGTITFRFTDQGREIGGFEMRILELRPDARVVWEVVKGPAEWVGTKIRFELKKEDDFTIVLFTHEGWREPVEFMYHCSTKWATFLMSLKSFIETGKGRPSPDDVKISNWH